MATGTELIDKFVTNVVNFHYGKPYMDPVEWERISPLQDCRDCSERGELTVAGRRGRTGL
jgi:hypothetical protein